MDLEVKEIITYLENDIKKFKLVLSENGKESEILLEGNGNLKAPIEV